jgi:hypothetical protein
MEIGGQQGHSQHSLRTHTQARALTSTFTTHPVVIMNKVQGDAEEMLSKR